ncbi:MAG: hypothetical protein ACYC2H_09610 [Thermoplasmatota archaeon]
MTDPSRHRPLLALLAAAALALLVSGCFGVPPGAADTGDSVSIRYTAYDLDSGAVLRENRTADFAVGSGTSGLGEQLERAMRGHKANETFTVTVRDDAALQYSGVVEVNRSLAPIPIVQSAPRADFEQYVGPATVNQVFPAYGIYDGIVSSVTTGDIALSGPDSGSSVSGSNPDGNAMQTVVGSFWHQDTDRNGSFNSGDILWLRSSHDTNPVGRIGDVALTGAQRGMPLASNTTTSLLGVERHFCFVDGNGDRAYAPSEAAFAAAGDTLRAGDVRLTSAGGAAGSIPTPTEVGKACMSFKGTLMSQMGVLYIDVDGNSRLTFGAVSFRIQAEDGQQDPVPSVGATLVTHVGETQLLRTLEPNIGTTFAISPPSQFQPSTPLGLEPGSYKVLGATATKLQYSHSTGAPDLVGRDLRVQVTVLDVQENAAPVPTGGNFGVRSSPQVNGDPSSVLGQPLPTPAHDGGDDGHGH